MSHTEDDALKHLGVPQHLGIPEHLGVPEHLGLREQMSAIDLSAFEVPAALRESFATSAEMRELLSFKPEDFRPVMPRDYVAESAERLQDLGESLRKAQEAKSARGHVRRLMARIRAFERKLTETQDVGVQLVSFGEGGGGITFHVSQLGYIEPSLILFIGQHDDGRPIELVQHVSKISFLLTVLPRLNPEEPRRQIGFLLEEGDEEEGAED